MCIICCLHGVFMNGETPCKYCLLLTVLLWGRSRDVTLNSPQNQCAICTKIDLFFLHIRKLHKISTDRLFFTNSPFEWKKNGEFSVFCRNSPGSAPHKRVFSGVCCDREAHGLFYMKLFDNSYDFLCFVLTNPLSCLYNIGRRIRAESV